MATQETFLSGAWGKAVFGATEIDLQEWSLEADGDDADLTSSGKPGFKRDMVITTGYSGRIAGNWKRTSPLTSILYRGECGTMKLYISSEAYHSVAVEIKGLRIISSAKDVVKYEYDFRATDWPVWAGITHRSSSSSSQSASSSSSSTSSST